jgi:hypothetical protein
MRILCMKNGKGRGQEILEHDVYLTPEKEKYRWEARYGRRSLSP